MLQNHQNVFYMWFRYKRLKKQVKTDQFHNNCRFQSLELHKMSNLVPKCFKWKKSKLKSLGSQKCSQNILGWKFTQTGNFYPSSYKIGKIVPGYSKLGILQILPLYYAWMIIWNNFNNFWKFTLLLPQNPKMTF